MVQTFLCLRVLHYPNYLRVQRLCLNPITIADFLVSFELEILHIFGRVHKITKRCYWLRYVCQPASPSVRPHGSTRVPPVGFSWLLIFEYFSKFCWNNQVSLTPDKDNGYSTWRRKCFYGNICLDSPYNEKYYGQKVQKESKYIFCPITFFWNSCRLWDNVENMVEPDISQITISHMRFPHWIPKSTYTHPEQVTLIAFARQ